jgi:GrpB-like predicted nucleotidyltransferase (UPF0157 family)
VPYDPGWPTLFEVERALLEPVLAPWLRDGVHHIGSTAVPGLAAKPVIDVMAGVRNLAEARAAFAALRADGYVHSPHRPGIAHHFDKRVGPLACGLHLTEPRSDLWNERLAFRDALRRDPALAVEYGELKLRLSRRHGSDIVSYTAAKRPFVGRVLAEAGLTFGRR